MECKVALSWVFRISSAEKATVHWAFNGKKGISRNRYRIHQHDGGGMQPVLNYWCPKVTKQVPWQQICH